ncbi:MAG: acyltransferase [Candidatus Brocadiaceae bacterium]|nr:acyltransferase [Candidatus Brocadiaceae bacterium]
METRKEKLFDINSTNSCKGVGLILLLWHHLFYRYPEFGFITYKTAILSKVCVTIFIIVSGYGFSESVKSKNIGIFEFYKKRLVTLYSNYWFISLIFVPIGIFLFDRTLQDVFLSHAYAKFIIQMTGLHKFAYSGHGYNPTWWYMSVIIPLVILFPFIYNLLKKYGVLLLILLLMVLLYHRPFIPVIQSCLLPFALGIYMSQKNLVVTISNRLCMLGVWRFVLLIMAIVLAGILRDLPGMKIGWLVGSLIILLVFELTQSVNVFKVVLGFLGKHLFNIFLFHTFIYLLFWKNFFYSFKYPLLIFVVLLICCIVISLMIEQLKRRVYFYELVRKASKLQIPSAIEIVFQKKISNTSR